MLDDLRKTIEKYRRLNKKDLPKKLMDVLGTIKEGRKIRINSRYSYILINPEEIVHCEAEEGYSILHLNTGKNEVSNTSLTIIENMLEGHHFYRLGRSGIINLNYVRSISKASDSVLLEYKNTKWEVFASHNAIKELLESSYNYA